MKRTLLFSTAAMAVALVVAATAAAKGASKAEVSGPGLNSPVVIAGGGEGPGTPLGDLLGGTGFFPAVFGQQPSPLLPGRPRGDLGPRYTVTYTVPGPSGTDEITQDLYPYAVGGPVTYTAPGQRIFGPNRTPGGWYRAPADFKGHLVEAGLPRSAPVGGDSASFPSPGNAWTLVLIAGAGALLVAFLSAFAVRHRRPAPAS